jgi:hypothetical protein
MRSKTSAAFKRSRAGTRATAIIRVVTKHAFDLRAAVDVRMVAVEGCSAWHAHRMCSPRSASGMDQRRLHSSHSLAMCRRMRLPSCRFGWAGRWAGRGSHSLRVGQPYEFRQDGLMATVAALLEVRLRQRRHPAVAATAFVRCTLEQAEACGCAAVGAAVCQKSRERNPAALARQLHVGRPRHRRVSRSRPCAAMVHPSVAALALAARPVGRAIAIGSAKVQSGGSRGAAKITYTVGFDCGS